MVNVNELDDFCQNRLNKRTQENSVPKDLKCCLNCKFFEGRTHFCRKYPPIPMVFSVNYNKENAISSKFPVITQPAIDWCGFFEYNELCK